MKKFRLSLCVFLSLFVFVFAVGCSGEKPRTAEFICFNSLVTVCVYDKPLSDEVVNEIKTTFTALEKEFSTTDGTFTSVFNAAEKNVPVPLSSHGRAVYDAAKAVYESTDGKFNPAVYPLIDLWGFTPDKYKRPGLTFTPPAEEQITAVLDGGITDFNKIKLTDDKTAAFKTDGAVKIDLGGILKGYAADLAGEILAEYGYASGYVSAGSSSIRLFNVDKLLVRHPEAFVSQTAPNALLSINCKDKTVSVSTSGVYERYNEYDGVKYPHVIDPATGRPTNGKVTSATVTGVDGATADALTTALCLCDFTETDYAETELAALIKKIAEKYPGAGIYAAAKCESGKYVITNEKENSDFTLKDGAYKVFTV